MDEVKNYILWPIWAVVLTLSVYLLLTNCLYGVLAHSSLIKEEALWKIVSDDLSYRNIDKKRQKEVQSLVDKLPINLLPEGYSKIKILVITSNQLNAFAAPGGRIILTTELLDAKLSEQALLFVIGHEIAHLSRKDHLYEFSKMIIAKIYGCLTRSELVAELLMLIDGYKLKETELIADKYSAKILLQIYGNTKGGEEFFRYLLQKDNNNDSFFHPNLNKRLDNLS